MTSRAVTDACPEPFRRRVAVRIAYRGEEFRGSQRQPDQRTVEGEVIRSLERISGGMMEGDFDLKAASRTDAGVSALGNVVAFRTPFRDDGELLNALNAVSRGVYYLAAAEIAPGRNIRRAVCRRYLYVLGSEGLDTEALRRCADAFRGEHDFAAFCRADGKPTRLSMEIAVEEGDGVLNLYFKSRFFLWNMIRRIVAALEKVGSGEASIEDVRKALDEGQGSFGLAPALPLTLLDVEYDDLVLERHDGPALERKLHREAFRSRLVHDFHSSLMH